MRRPRCRLAPVAGALVTLKLYLAARPQVDDRATFAKDCPVPESRNTFVVGCSQAARTRIFILRVNDLARRLLAAVA